MTDSALQPMKARFLMLIMDLGKIISRKLRQSMKASLPMSVIQFGMTTISICLSKQAVMVLPTTLKLDMGVSSRGMMFWFGSISSFGCILERFFKGTIGVCFGSRSRGFSSWGSSC